MRRCTRLTSPLLAKLVDVLTLLRSGFISPSAPLSKSFDCDPIQLSPDDIQALEKIVRAWGQPEIGCTRNLNEIIYIALCRLQWDLDSGCEDEVVEEVQREIDYRLWCARNSL
jgi:hypothetical protein